MVFDGREVYDQSASVRESQSLQRGDSPQDQQEDGDELCGLFFCSEPYRNSSSGSFATDAVNHATIEVQCKANSSTVNLIAEHERVIRISASGSINVNNN